MLKSFYLIGVLLLSLAAPSLAQTAPATQSTYAPLPAPPPGFAIREVARMPAQPVRLTSDGTGTFLYVLTLEGDIDRINLPGGQLKPIIDHAKYQVAGSGQCVGICLSKDRRLYVVSNEFDFANHPAQNHVRIYRSDPTPAGADPAALKLWFETQIPFAVDVFQHSVTMIVQGPDDMMYISSGSRTDHGEAGAQPNISRDGETPISACIWRLDPKSDHPRLQVFARGLRNAFGMCFDDRGRLFATENGPNANPPEEINLIQEGKNYGFPHQFSDWKNKAYPDQPDAKTGTKFELPIQNIGPDGGGSEVHPLSTLDPHSSPSAIVYLGDDFPVGYRQTFLITRFGNLLGLKKDVGFDLVQMRLHGAKTGRLQAEFHTMLSPLARPTDLHHSGLGKLYICELWRQTHNAGSTDPGRILELSVKANER